MTREQFMKQRAVMHHIATVGMTVLPTLKAWGAKSAEDQLRDRVIRKGRPSRSAQRYAIINQIRKEDAPNLRTSAIINVQAKGK